MPNTSHSTFTVASAGSSANDLSKLDKEAQNEGLLYPYLDVDATVLRWFHLEYYLSKDLSARYAFFRGLSLTLGVSAIFLLISNVLLIVSLFTNPFVFSDFAHRLFPQHSNFLRSVRHRHDWNLEMPSAVTVEWLNKNESIKPIHSHNDYWRAAPLFEALSLGVESVEADIWAFQNNDEIYVGHHLHLLSSTNTLANLYLKPLENLLDKVNVNNSTSGEDLELNKKGVFYEDPSKTLMFLIDVKNNPDLSVTALQESVRSLQEKGYLTSYDPESDSIQWSCVTFVLTGDYPLEKLKHQDIFNLFADAPLTRIFDDDNFKSDFVDTKLAMLTSSSLKELTRLKGAANVTEMKLSTEQEQTLAKYITKAHELGLKTRIWETPNHPTTVRDNVWRQLIELGSDVLNADDLRSAATLF